MANGDKMKGVSEFTAEEIKNWDCLSETKGGWVLARPIGRTGILWRLRKAWCVFMCRADIVIWHNQ